MYPHCLEVMLAALRAEPGAAFALTNRGAWSGGPAPMLLTPRLAYAREYLGTGMFHGGPACALFRRQAFIDLGAFPESGCASDHLFWMSACARVPVVLVSGDLFWYRVHAGQELSSRAGLYESARIEGRFWRVLDEPWCPLDASEREIAKRNATFNIAKHLARDLRRGRWQLAAFRLRYCGLSLYEWVRYLRVPRRTLDAGTPAHESHAAADPMPMKAAR
jgi:hypothetical protein